MKAELGELNLDMYMVKNFIVILSILKLSSFFLFPIQVTLFNMNCNKNTDNAIGDVYY